MNIEPTVARDGNVVADVETEVSSIDRSVTVEGVPGLLSRRTKTEVDLKQGETLAISGLVNQQLSKDVAKVKWLSDLPILGALFKSTDFNTNRSDLVIFITPEIYDATSEETKARVARAEELRKKFLESIKESAEILE